MATESKYYDEVKEQLITKYKTLVEQCFKIMEKEIDDKLTDDKLHNVLKAKRMASEDAKFYAKEIEAFENEQNGVETTSAPKSNNAVNRFKK